MNKFEYLNPNIETNSNCRNDRFAVILSEAKNLLFGVQVLRLRLRMTHRCHFGHLNILISRIVSNFVLRISDLHSTACLVGFTLICAFAVPICLARGDVAAAELVRAVRESENWIHNIDSLLIRIESNWTRIATPLRGCTESKPCVESDLEPKQFTPATARSAETSPASPASKGILEYAFDQTRVRFLSEEIDCRRQLKVWDGRQLIAHEKSFANNRESYTLNWTAQGSFDEFMAYQTSWLRAQPHSFWWDSKDTDGLICYYGRPEEFALAGRSNYRGIDCYVLEFHPTEVRGIVDAQSYRCDSQALSGDEYGLIGEARGLADQSYCWYVGVEDHRLYGLVWLIGKKPHTEHWMSDYKQVAAGCWFPMTQGYELYGRDSNGEPCLYARRELKVLQVQVNEKLPDELFQIELKKGVTVVDSRSGRTTRYTYEPEPPQLIGNVLPQLEDISVELSAEQPPLSRGGKMLVCFWDVEQRPSRHCITKLAEQAKNLAEQNVTVIAVQAPAVPRPSWACFHGLEARATRGVDQKFLDHWVEQHNIPFLIGIIQGNAETIKYSWGVRSLPWLILTDERRVVSAEGFGTNELASRIAQVVAARPVRESAGR